MADEQFTARENYYKVLTWWPTPAYAADLDLRFPRKVLVGHAAKDSDKVVFECPEPPSDPSRIINWGLPINDQVWLRVEMPHCWSEEYLRDVAVARFSSGTTEKQRVKNADYNWHKNEDNWTEEQGEFADLMWDRRLDGVWVMIGGEPVYLTGKFYTYLQWWWLADTYPEYTERDLLVFYHWQVVVEDALCRGGIYPKGRRGGFTSKFSFEGVDETTRTKGGHFGIQAAGETGAAKVFRDKVIPGWKKWPAFFKPITSSGDNPQKEIVMDVESRRGRTKHTAALHEGLAGWIKYSPNGKKGVDPFDGDKLLRFLRDEGGKADTVDILDNWSLVSPTLIGRTVRGKAMWPSSVEDVDGEHKGKFKALYDQSLPSLRESTGTGTTPSFLLALFLPIYCSHPEYWFIGKFGESIVHKPTPEQREWLLANRAINDKHREDLARIYDQGGAYEYELRMRAACNNDPGYIRKNPFTVEEAFISSNPRCHFNIENLMRLRSALEAPVIVNGKVSRVVDTLSVQGRLAWVGAKMGDVMFVEDPSGPFRFNRAYLPGGKVAEALGMRFNAVVRDVDGVSNGHGSRAIVGFDPQKSDSEDATGHKSSLSKAGGHGFFPYDPVHEKGAWDEQVPGFAEGFGTHAFMFEYFQMPKSSFQAAEDMVMACIFLNAKFHCERQVATAIQVFKSLGAGRLLLYDARLGGANVSTKVVAAGQQTTVATHIAGDAQIRDYVQWFPYPQLCPFLETVNQWISYDGSNSKKLDLKVSSEMTLMGVNPDGVARHKVDQMKASRQPDKTYRTVSDWASQYM